MLQTSSTLLENLHWTKTFWQPTKADETTHVLGLNWNDGARGPNQLWVVGALQYATLRFNNFKSWNIKVIPKDADMTMLKRKLQTRGILGNDWSGDSMAKSLSISTKPEYVNFQTLVMDEKSEPGANAATQQERLLPLYLRRCLRRESLTWIHGRRIHQRENRGGGI